MKKNFLYATVLLFTLFYTQGCVPYTPIQKEQIPKELTSTKLPHDIPKWWRAFGDKELNRVMEIALEHNYDIQQAKSAIKEANYALLSTQSTSYPQVDISLGSTYSVDHTTDNHSDYSNHSLSLQSSYEVDLWGKINALEVAAQHQYQAKIYDYQTIYTTLSSDVVTTWYTLAYYAAYKRVLQARLKLAKNELTMLKKRFLYQEAKSVDILSQKSEIKQIEASLVTLDYQEHTYRNMLNALLGGGVSKYHINLPRKLPSKLPHTHRTLAVKTLYSRPDIKAAYERLQADDAQSAAIVWSQYPRFTLSSSLKSSELDHLFDLWYLSLADSLTAPLFRAGELENNAKEALEKRHTSLLAFRQQLLDASIETSNALKALQTQQKLYALVQEQRHIDREKERAYRMSYLHGTEDFKRYFDAQTASTNTQERVLSTHLQLIESYITLMRVTASGWLPLQPEEKQ